MPTSLVLDGREPLPPDSIGVALTHYMTCYVSHYTRIPYYMIWHHVVLLGFLTTRTAEPAAWVAETQLAPQHLKPGCAQISAGREVISVFDVVNVTIN
eukprot:6190840-Pleurochrysis_carterae.AAC.5